MVGAINDFPLPALCADRKTTLQGECQPARHSLGKGGGEGDSHLGVTNKVPGNLPKGAKSNSPG